MNKDLLGHIDRVIEQRPASREALESYRQLAVLMNEIQPGSEEIFLDERIIGIKNKEGFPLFSRDDLPLDFEKASDLLKMFLQRLASTERKDKDGLKKASEKAEAEHDWSARVYSAVLDDDTRGLAEIAGEVDMHPATLGFLAQLSLKPFLEAIRHAVKEKMDKAGWRQGFCPLCGSRPYMSYFNRTGRRYLACELCGEEWPFDRLKCPFCGNTDHNTLGYFLAEQEEGFRVDFCRKCKRYLKVVDQRVFEKAAPMELENLATLHLDLLAGRGGFK